MTARVPDYQSYNCPLPIVVPGVTTVDCRYPLIFTWGRVSGPKTTQPVSVWLQNSVTKDNISSSYHIYSTTLSIFILYLFIQKMCCVDITYLNLILCCTYFTYRINIMYLIQFLYISQWVSGSIVPSSESTLQLCTLQNLIIDTISIIIMRESG